MSLKAFHVIFVSAPIAVSLFLGIWSFKAYQATGARIDLAYVIASSVAVVAQLVYGRYFLKILKHISYL